MKKINNIITALLVIVSTTWFFISYNPDGAVSLRDLLLMNNQPQSDIIKHVRKQRGTASISITVLIQQSPVRRAKQIDRLLTIDRTWARPFTLFDSGQCSFPLMRLIAVVPMQPWTSSEVQHQHHHFDHLQLLHVVALQYNYTVHNNTTSTDSAYYNMAQSLTSVVFDSTYQSQWLLMCNDHTFVFQSNLLRFLEQLDYEDLIYSGSQLSIRYRGRVVSFASGGAGVVLSRAAAELVLMTWHLISDDAVSTALLDILGRPADRHAACVRNVLLPGFFSYDRSSASIVVNISRDGGGGGVGCLLVLLRRWLARVELSGDEVGGFTYFSTADKVTVTLSSRVAVTLNRGHRGHQQKNNSSNSNPPRFTMTVTRGGSSVRRTDTELLRSCLPSDKWSHENPGIILADCLLNTFNVSFSPSTVPIVREGSSAVRDMDPLLLPSPLLPSRERFNAYGAVRTLFKEYDDWYIDAKRLVGQSLSQVVPQVEKKSSQLSLLLLSHPVISFHYVSELETELLYRWVEAPALEVAETQYCRQQQRSSSINASLIVAARRERCGSPAVLRELWPRTNSEAGDYSRPLSHKSPQEADQLYSFLIEQLS